MGAVASMHSYTERCIETWHGMCHAERRKSFKVGNPIGRRAEVLDREAKQVARQEGQAGMGILRRRMLSAERGAISAEDAQSAQLR